MSIKKKAIPNTVWKAYNDFANALDNAFSNEHPGLYFPEFCNTESGDRMEELVQELWDEGFEIALSEYKEDEDDE